MSKGLPKYPVPIVIIGRLARHLHVRGQGYGERLLLDAHDRAVEISSHGGAVAVVVDAKDAAAAAFYEGFGYQYVESGQKGVWPRRMFLSLEDIRNSNEATGE
ncbi:GNAT family N-acetyltransferase [Archangium violaceum]|uniref:GNAT family N-acetyltransferase n=1 Tax=Archangium violaceum TaxID=83451 RepID=UPI002E13CC48|nr:GNAT family N-acetyltransferase [Archangium violaceum]